MSYMDPCLRSDGLRGTYFCILCNAGGIRASRGAVRSHLAGREHRRGLREERARVGDEIRQLGLVKWRLHVKEMWFAHPSFFDSVREGGGGGGVPYSIKRTLRMYTNIERTSLLELAVWKASCLWFDGSGRFETMQDIIEWQTVYKAFDPVSYKNDRRFTSSVAVIMRLVLEFL